ncbi:NB-ARC domain-containing protein [Sorangium sp. So ce204]|uniref:NB-ARC domain-containing protein n=1 Tax=Sorangium sp. So ce204 TaxID=3133288 RepID=UPI003F60D183
MEHGIDERLRAATHVVILVSARLLDWPAWRSVAHRALAHRRRAEVSLVRWRACVDDQDLVLRRFGPILDPAVATVIDPGEALVAIARRVGEALRAARLGPRCVALGRLPPPEREIVGREQEKRSLDDALVNDAVQVVVVVGEGGAGKTQLVRTWLDGMQPVYGGVEAVISCSIEDQDGGGAPSASAAVSVLLASIGETPSADPMENVSRLVRRVRDRRTIVVIDGLEPLQDARGKLIDRHMGILVRELASQMYGGLCVITTRPPFDLEGAGVRRIQLGPVDRASAVQVLRSRGVRGSDEQLGRLADRLRRHALSLALVGDYLNEAHGGDVVVADRLDLGAEDIDDGGRIQRILSFYEERLKPEERAVLGIVALCERPTDLATLAALGARAGASGFASALGEASLQQLRRICARLEKTALLLKTETDAWDQHPLMRGFWRHRLEASDPAGVRSAHERLFDWFRDLSPRASDGTVRREDLDPLYAAVAHGLQAHRWSESFEVLHDRIREGERHRSLKLHGTVAEDRRAFLAFFDRRTFDVTGDLAPAQRHWLENSAGVLLRAHGETFDAVRLLEHAVRTANGAGLIAEAAESVRNLASVHSLRGNLTEAIACVESAVRHADASGKLRPRVIARDFRAHLLHRFGRLHEAHAAFEEIEQIRDREIAGHVGMEHYALANHAVLLLDLDEVELAHDRAVLAVELAYSDDPGASSLLNRGLSMRTLARASLALGRTDEAMQRFEEAAQIVRDAGRWDHLPPCYLDCALFWADRNADHARRHLAEARRIFEGCGFLLIEADAALITARVALAENMLTEAAKELDVAEALLGETRYRVRVPWLHALRARLCAAQGDHAGVRREADLARQEASEMGLKTRDLWRELESYGRIEESS